MPNIRIIPVIDLKGGHVVHAVAGRREEYRPIVSKLTTSTDAVEMAKAFKDRFGFTELYLADLDAILGGEPSWPVYWAIRDLKFKLSVDAGVKDVAQAQKLRDAGVHGIVAALETLPGPQMLKNLVRKFGREHIIFSLDLKAGDPMGNRLTWDYAGRWDIAQRAFRLGVRRMIVLDLTYIGTGQGPGTELLCRDIRELDPDLELIAGGGIRTAASLKLLEQQGVDAALVATALHEGRIRREQIG